MRTKLLNLAYLGMAFLATGLLIHSKFGLFGFDGSQTAITSDLLLSAIPEIFLLSGFLFLLYTLYKYPSRKKVVDLLLQRSMEDPHKNSCPVTESVGVELFEVELDTLVAITTEDFELEPPKSELLVSTRTFNLSNGDDSEHPKFNSLSLLEEAELLSTYGQNNQAVTLLLDAFSETFKVHDDLVLKILEIIDREIHSVATSAQRLKALHSKRDVLLTKFALERGKLSDEVWLQIYAGHPVQTDQDYKDPTTDEELYVYKEANTGI